MGAMTFAQAIKKRGDAGAFTIMKTDDDNKQVFGWGSVAVRVDGETVVDSQDDVLEIEVLEKAAYDFVFNYRSAGVNHEWSDVGQLIENAMFTVEKMAAMGTPEGVVLRGLWLGFHIADDEVWAIKKTAISSPLALRAWQTRSRYNVDDAKQGMMYTSLDEFAEVVRNAMPSWAAGEAVKAESQESVSKNAAQLAAYDEMIERHIAPAQSGDDKQGENMQGGNENDCIYVKYRGNRKKTLNAKYRTGRIGQAMNCVLQRFIYCAGREPDEYTRYRLQSAHTRLLRRANLQPCLKPGEIVKRAWSFRFNEAPELLEQFNMAA
jgi:hypothetical protein